MLRRNATNHAGAYLTGRKSTAVWLKSTQLNNPWNGMNPTYTTHLICTPDLDGSSAAIVTMLVFPGDHVEMDDPLVLLRTDDNNLEVCAPEAGTIGEIVAKADDNVRSGDLLLTMEIEEKPFGFLPMMEEEPGFAPSCQLPYPKHKTTGDHTPLKILPETASMAARLGVDLADVSPDMDGVIDNEAVASYIRDVMVRWRKLRRLITE
ncbi:MAG: hypothetical protein P4L87_15440 [Formivibrio sp.]|nr:hypothetical protein [Formivibrio sp.]